MNNMLLSMDELKARLSAGNMTEHERFALLDEINDLEEQMSDDDAYIRELEAKVTAYKQAYDSLIALYMMKEEG